MRMKSFIVLLFSCLGVFVLGIGCTSSDPINNPILTIDDEKAIGDKLAKVARQMPDDFVLLNEAQYKSVYNYIGNVLGSLVRTSQVKSTSTFDWEVFIIRDDNVRSAFTAPGGKVFIYTGLLKFLTTESELTGVLAHEIYYSDRSRKYSETELSPSATVLKNALVGDGNGTQFLLDILDGYNDDRAEMMISTLRSIQYNDDVVFLADQFAMQVVCPFAWDSQGLPNVLKTIRNKNIVDFDWLQTHPPLYPEMGNAFAARINKLESLATPCDGYIVEQGRYTNEVLHRLPL
jgi:predicted Zn-dependent protease